MERIKVSVIVPIYNALSENRLYTLINCLKAQTLKEIEFILVLDCPTDGSDIEVFNLTKYDQRFNIIKNAQNEHIGNSRNKGLQIARGEFIAFADHDDYIEKDMYKDLYNIANINNADVVISPPIIQSYSKEHIEYFDNTPNNFQQYLIDRLIGEKSDYERNKEIYPYLFGNGNIWNKIFRRQIIAKYNIKFIDTQKGCFEDILFQIQYLCKTQKISFTNNTYYTHIFYEKSGNTSTNKTYFNNEHYCYFLNELIYLYYNNSNLISKERVSFRITKTLVPIIAYYIKNRKYNIIKSILNIYNKKELAPLISIRNKGIKGNYKTKLFYSFYSIVLIILLNKQ